MVPCQQHSPFKKCHSLLIGVDGGASHTSGIVTNCRGDVIEHRWEAKPANPNTSGLENSIKNVALLIIGLYNDAKLSNDGRRCFANLQQTSIVVALSGGDTVQQCNQYRVLLQNALSSHLSSFKLDVIHDAVAPLATILGLATPENNVLNGDAVCLIAGSGSVAIRAAFENNKFSVLKRCGGWGHVIGDQGSAYYITVTALHCCFKIIEAHGNPLAPLETCQNEKTKEAKIILRKGFEHFSVDTDCIADLAAILSNSATTKAHIASFARCIGELAQNDVHLCRRILYRAGQELGKLLADVVDLQGTFHNEGTDEIDSELFLKARAIKSQHRGPIDVCCVGGVFNSWEFGVSRGMLDVLQQHDRPVTLHVRDDSYDTALCSAQLAGTILRTQHHTCEYTWTTRRNVFKQVLTVQPSNE